MNDINQKERSHIAEIAASWQQERPDLDLSNFLLAIYVMRLGRVVDDIYDRMCRKRFGISGADMRVIFALRRAGKPYARRPARLFRALLVTSGAMTKQVDRLSALGFVERVDDPGYAGGVLIRLTAKGLKAANTATQMLAVSSPIAGGVAMMTQSERTAGTRFVEQVLEQLEIASKAAASKPGAKTTRVRRRTPA